MSTIKEIKEKNDAELRAMLASAKDKLRDLRFRLSGAQIKNVRELSSVRKDIARILTVLKEREAASGKKS
jgi:large subunit ribosomal protein L29